MEARSVDILAVVATIMCCLIHPTHAADCSNWIFLCEHEEITVDASKDMSPLRMPLTSADCNTDPDPSTYCRSKLKTKFGQKIFVRVGIVFGVGATTSPCDDARHVMFSSRTDGVTKTDRKCGQLRTGQELFESVENEMTIEYKSDSVDDGAAIQIVAFGCAAEDFPAPNLETKLELTTPGYGYADTQYTGQVRCDPGYLMPDLVDTKAVYCRGSQIEYTTRRRWEWDVSDDQYTCNRVSCEELLPPTNSKYELTNQRYHGSVATYSCADGFTVEGNTTQTCMVEPVVGGVWQGASPTCKIVDCGIPMIDKAMYTLPSLTTFQSSFEYWCDAGLIPATAHARCGADGIWSHIQCQEIVCPVPRASSSWKMLSESHSTSKQHIGSTISYSCIYDNSIAAIRCEGTSNNSGAKWTLLPACRMPDPTIAPIERIASATGAEGLKRSALADKGGLIGGVISGFIFAIIIIVIACIFIRKSKARRKAEREARNNNDKEEMKRLHPVNSSTGQRPTKPKRLHNGSSDYNKTDVEKAMTAEPVQEYANVVKHFHNRGNNRRLNGSLNGSVHTNSNNSNNNGTSSSRGSANTHQSDHTPYSDHAPHSDHASSVGMLDTGGDLLASVMGDGNMHEKTTSNRSSPTPSTPEIPKESSNQKITNGINGHIPIHGEVEDNHESHDSLL